jgi:ATP-dependent DNA helicase 2 subunit 2
MFVQSVIQRVTLTNPPQFRRELSIGEIQYVWADPSSAQQQVALSSIVQAMYEKNVMAIARWVTKDGMDPKMGVLSPVVFDGVDCLIWIQVCFVNPGHRVELISTFQMPFADDLRKYTFASLDNLVSKKGEIITEHPYIPSKTQLDAMDKFVDDMDLMEAGEKDDEGYVPLPRIF